MQKGCARSPGEFQLAGLDVSGRTRRMALRYGSTGLVIDILAHVSLETPRVSQTSRVKHMDSEKRRPPPFRPF